MKAVSSFYKCVKAILKSTYIANQKFNEFS